MNPGTTAISPRTQIAIYCIYENPSDFPGKFVVRRWVGPAPDPHCEVCETLSDARMAVPYGLTRIGRDDRDDPCIVESWL